MLKERLVVHVKVSALLNINLEENSDSQNCSLLQRHFL
jgi:hypothetical protein